MSPRILVTIIVIVLIIVAGMVLTVKHSVPTMRKGDPNAEPPVTQPAPRK
jgi:hypothetical protein